MNQQPLLTSTANNSVILIQLLLHNEIENLVRSLRDDDADVNVGHEKDGLCELFVQLKGVLFAAVRVDEQQQLPRSF
jgi:hypothetical protein